MPWSQTPVVSCQLAKALSGLLPSARMQSVGFFPYKRDYPNDHNYTFFGAQYTACILDPSSSVLPLLGLHVDFTTDLSATL